MVQKLVFPSFASVQLHQLLSLCQGNGRGRERNRQPQRLGQCELGCPGSVPGRDITPVGELMRAMEHGTQYLHTSCQETLMALLKLALLLCVSCPALHLGPVRHHLSQSLAPDSSLGHVWCVRPGWSTRGIMTAAPSSYHSSAADLFR